MCMRVCACVCDLDAGSFIASGMGIGQETAAALKRKFHIAASAGWTPEGAGAAGRNHQALYQAWLNTDIATAASPVLPTSPPTETTLREPVVLQIQWIVNVGESMYSQLENIRARTGQVENSSRQAVRNHGPTGGGANSKRLLKIKLTDGATDVYGSDHVQRLSFLSTDTPAGSKLRVAAGTKLIKNFLQLSESNCKLLGGSVPAIANANAYRNILERAFNDGEDEEEGAPRNAGAPAVSVAGNQAVAAHEEDEDGWDADDMSDVDLDTLAALEASVLEGEQSMDDDFQQPQPSTTTRVSVREGHQRQANQQQQQGQQQRQEIQQQQRRQRVSDPSPSRVQPSFSKRKRLSKQATLSTAAASEAAHDWPTEATHRDAHQQQRLVPARQQQQQQAQQQPRQQSLRKRKLSAAPDPQDETTVPTNQTKKKQQASVARSFKLKGAMLRCEKLKNTPAAGWELPCTLRVTKDGTEVSVIMKNEVCSMLLGIDGLKFKALKIAAAKDPAKKAQLVKKLTSAERSMRSMVGTFTIARQPGAVGTVVAFEKS
eukprot:m.151601 g.151601  ORF g.151601 m.151601 type:complete len:545 (+) comp17415_c0_seq1:945-2579(+)